VLLFSSALVGVMFGMIGVRASNTPTSPDEIKVYDFLVQHEDPLDPLSPTNADKLGMDPDDTSTWGTEPTLAGESANGFWFNSSRRLTHVECRIRNDAGNGFDSPGNISANLHGTLDLEDCIALTSVRVANNSLAGINIRGATELTRLGAGNNQLTAIDMLNNTKMATLVLSNNQLTSLDVSNAPALIWFYASDNQLTTLDVSNRSALRDLQVEGNPNLGPGLNMTGTLDLTSLVLNNIGLTKLDVSDRTSLHTLKVADNPGLGLDFKIHNEKIWRIFYAYSIGLTTLDMSDNPELWDLRVGNNPALGNNLNINDTPKLQELYVNGIGLTSLDVSGREELLTLVASDNNNLDTLNIDNTPALRSLSVSISKIESLDVSNNPELRALHVHNTNLTALDLTTNTAINRLQFTNSAGFNLTNPNHRPGQLFTGWYTSASGGTKVEFNQNIQYDVYARRED